MNLLNEIQRIFQLEKITVSERIKVLESSFLITKATLPSLASIKGLLDLSPDRDTLRICLRSDNENNITITSKNICSCQDYDAFYNSQDEENILNINISIEKEIRENTFSIYDLPSFSNDLIQLETEQVMKAFALLLHGCEYLIFDLFDQDYVFTTSTMFFLSSEKNKVNKNLLRSNRLKDCKETAYFYNMSFYELLPDDFIIELDYENNPLTNLFNKICTTLSLAYISSSASIGNNNLTVQINGQRNIDAIYDLRDMKSNFELYKIYRWIYTDGCSVDKAIIARNVISLHCRLTKIIDIDEKTFASIQSNYNLYIKDNVTQYLELKNKLAEFIRDIVSKTGDYATQLLGKFKSNLIAIFGFLFTVILANIVSDQPLGNIFTKEITSIIEFVLLGSVAYLIITIIEVKYKLKKAVESYFALKDNYKPILSDLDLNEIFKNDDLIKKVSKSVNNGIKLYSIIWIVFLSLSLVFIEVLSSDPNIRPFINNLIQIIFR